MITFKPDEVRQLIETIWSAVLGLPIEPIDAGAAGGATRAESPVTASVRISGAWNGSVLFACHPHVARQAASVMFGTPPGAVTPADMRDAVAELVNMAGGNLKGLLPETCVLSLPGAVTGPGAAAGAAWGQLAGQFAFACLGYEVSLTVLEEPGQQQQVAAA